MLLQSVQEGKKRTQEMYQVVDCDNNGTVRCAAHLGSFYLEPLRVYPTIP